MITSFLNIQIQGLFFPQVQPIVEKSNKQDSYSQPTWFFFFFFLILFNFIFLILFLNFT